MSDDTKIQFPPAPSAPGPGDGSAARELPLEMQLLRRVLRLEADVKRLIEIDAEGHINDHDRRLDEHEFQLTQHAGLISDLRSISDRLTQAMTISALCVERIDKALPAILNFIQSK